MACELISWLCGKTSVLMRLWDIQTQSGKQPLTVICAVLTRWMAHYLAFRHLLKLKLPLQALVNQDVMVSPGQQILIPLGLSAANKRKVHEMVVIIEDSNFWHLLAWYDLI